MRSRELIDRALRRGLERLHGASPVLVPRFPLDLRSRWGWEAPVAPAIGELLAAGIDGYEPAVADVCELLDWARTVPRLQRNAREPCWENSFWGTIDALVQCAALKRRDPALYLEVGSGFSTMFARRAITDFGLRTRIVSIDPEPRAEVDACCDEVIRSPLADVSGTVFERLRAGDVFLLDGSHTALMNSDTTVFFFEVMPQLAAGVLVGIDDIFLPWDYPPTWRGRIYGEQYLLAAFLLGGASGWRIRFPGWWLVEESPLAARFDELWPVVENRFGRHAGSFWMERVVT
jgi:hypothetical protein